MSVEAPPKDHGGFVRHLFFFIAFVPLLSWNFFTMLTGYWMFKFRDPEPVVDLALIDPGSQLNATTNSSLDEVKNALQVDFTSYMVRIAIYGYLKEVLEYSLQRKFRLSPAWSQRSLCHSSTPRWDTGNP